MEGTQDVQTPRGKDVPGNGFVLDDRELPCRAETPGVLAGETPGTGRRGANRQGRGKRRRWNEAGMASLRLVDTQTFTR